MIALTTTLLALAAAAPPCLPRGDAQDDLRERICGLAGAIDTAVPDAAWRNLPPEADALLAELAGSPQELSGRRAHALAALAARGGPLAERTHRALASDPAAPVVVRRGAIRGLARLLPPAELGRTLGPVLAADGEDPRARAAAAEVLARHDPAGACAPIRARAAADGREAALLSSALARCTAARR